MSPAERLMWLSIITFIVVVLTFLAIWFFEADARATQHCVEQGYSEAYCGWR